MPVLTLIILIALILENSGQSLRYAVTISPNWNHIYTTDSVTLRCDIGPNENIDNLYVYWYKDDKQKQQRGQEFTIDTATYSDAGEYQCWTGSGDRSHPLRLYVVYKDSIYSRPTVIFSPKYRNIFVGEKMEISCEDGSAGTQSQKYEWYKDNERLKNDEKLITINWVNDKDSGDYRCRKGSTDSYPVRLDVYPKDRHIIILQTPPDIVEGDRLFWRCHSPAYYNDKEGILTFYKDNAIIQTTKHILELTDVNKSMTGTYRCERKLKSGILLKAEETYIHVQDLFTRPTIKVSPSIKEGDAMTLTCDTRRNPLRENTKLHFTFYRNGQKVEKAGSSGTYTVQSAQLEDSGSYNCEAGTPSRTLMKLSDVSNISITEFEKPKLQIDPKRIQEGNKVTIKCLSSERLYSPSYTFYRDSQTVQHKSNENQYVILRASEKDTGNYQCSLTYSGISKNSSEQMILVEIPVDKPKLMILSNKVAMGDEAVLRCESSKGSLPIQYLFYFNESLLGNMTIPQKEAAEIILTIKSLNMSGPYYCASYNDFHTQHLYSEKVILLVMEPVSDITISTDKESEVYVLGENLTFTCSVRRGTSISVSWQHNKTVVEQNSELFQLQHNGKVLYIHSLQHSHKGTYQCNAKNELSVNRTFSVLSEIRNINVLDLRADDHTLQWSMLGILLLVIILVGGLIIMCRKKIFSAGSCLNKTPSSGRRTEKNNEDVNNQNTITVQEVVYANVTSRKGLDHEDEGCTYITVKAVSAPSSSPDVQRDDCMVVYSEVRRA